MLPVVLFALALLAELDTLAGPQGVCLRDAREFGVRAECVQGMWMLARQHPDAVRAAMQVNNSAETVWEWEKECAWRIEAWNQLDNVLRCTSVREQRLRCLAALKAHIGDEMYEARVMPAPLPTYRGTR